MGALRAGNLETVGQSTAQRIDGGLRFDAGKSYYLNRTPSVGNRKTWTWSGWVKRSKLGASQMLFNCDNGTTDSTFGFIAFLANDRLRVAAYDTDWRDTSAVFRDVSAWCHLVVAFDTTQTTAANRVKVYLNGVQVTDFATSNDPSLNTDYAINQAAAHNIGRTYSSYSYLDGYLSNVYFIDGQALGPEYFGYTDPLTNVWRPKKFKPQATPNDGTVWSSGAGANFESGNPATNGFNGNPESYTRTDNANVTATVTLPSSVPFTTLQVRGARDSGNGTITVNGVDVSSQFTSSSATLETVTITGVTSPLTSISLGGIAGAAQPRFSQIIVDGVTLIDGDTSNIGLNGFHLPFDGSAPIGQDQSGKVGIAWTAVNFGGSNTIEKATGALPILNTDGGGKVARVGVRTDAYYANLKLAVPFVGVATDVVQQINGNSATMTSFTANNATFAVHPTAGAPYSNGLYLNTVSDYPNINFSAGTFNFLHNQTGNGTVEFWMYNGAYTTEASMLTNTAGSPDVGLNIQMASSTTLQAVITRGVSGSGRATGTANVSQNTWHHIAVTKQIVGSNCELKVYVNGVLSASNTSITASDLSNSNSTYSYFRIGQNPGDEGGRGWTNYYMNDLRIYDTVKYTSNFIPASTDPDIVPDSPSGVSYSSNVALVPSTDGAVAFDGSGDYLSLGNDDTNFQLDGDFTVEFFVYAPTISGGSGYQYLIDYAADGNNGWGIAFYNNQLYGFFGSGSNGFGPDSNTQLNARQWYHIAWTREGSQHYFYKDGIKYTGNSVSGTQPATSSSNVLNIGRFMNNTSYFTGFISNVNIVKETALYTGNFTPPSAPISSVANTKLLCCKSNTLAGAAAVSPNISGINDGTVWSTLTSGGTVNPSYPMSQTFDGSTSTAGVRAVSSGGFIFGGSLGISYSSSIRIHSGISGVGTQKFRLNDGSETDFAENTWVTVASGSGTLNKLEITAGTTGNANIYLGAVEVDGVILVDPVTANGNAAATNFNPFTVDIDTQRGKQSGYATLNPLQKGSAISLSNGNLNASTSSTTDKCVVSTIGMTTGKWYFELTITNIGDTNGGEYAIGFGSNPPIESYIGSNSTTWSYASSGSIMNNTGTTAYGSSYTTGDVLGAAFDGDNGTLAFYKNGIRQGTVATGLTSGPYFFLVGTYNSSGTRAANFGQKPFKFPPPAGFQPLTLANTPRPTIVRPDQYVGVTTYTGNGAARNITVGWKPDFVWLKRRGTTSENHVLANTVVGANAFLSSDLTNAENTASNCITGFTNDGFAVGTQGIVNDNTMPFVAWCWKAGGNSNTFNIDDVGYASASAAGLTAGTITPTGASVNTKSGFSIITHSGSGSTGTISHGLGKAAAFIITKIRTSGVTSSWQVYHQSLGATKYITLDETAAAQTSSTRWNDTAPTSSLISLGSNTASSYNWVMYAWAEIPGFSKFGSYTGTSGQNFVELGFKPAWVMIKNSSSSSYLTYTGWAIFDGERTPYNVVSNALFANKSQQENLRGNGGAVTVADFSLDLLSNGFCLRDNGASEINLSGNTYIYAAFAEAPTFNLYGAQANAR